MSHGFAGEGEQFFRGWALRDVPAGFSFLVELRDESGEPAIIKRLGGVEMACRVGDALREQPEARQALVVEMRQKYWWVRNQRWATDLAKAAEAEMDVLDLCCMLELGGVDPRDIIMTAQCLQNRCVCTNCDCYNGARVLETA